MKVVNKISEQVEKYIKQTGATKKFICDKLEISYRRYCYIINSENLSEEVYKKFANVLNCKVTELYIIELSKDEKYYIKED